MAALKIAKSNLRRTLREALKGMTVQERAEQSQTLTEKVDINPTQTIMRSFLVCSCFNMKYIKEQKDYQYISVCLMKSTHH